MRAPNVTLDIYLGTNTPPAAPDTAGATGHLRPSFRLGQDANDANRTFVWTDILEVPLHVEIHDTYPGAPAQRIFIPHTDTPGEGQEYRVVFVETVTHFHTPKGRSFKRVYLERWARNMALTVREVDGTPTYTTVNVIEFDQSDGFSLSEPAPGVIRVDLATGAGTVTSVDINSTVGLAFAGGPITTSGTFSTDGYLFVNHGGTGRYLEPFVVGDLLYADDTDHVANLAIGANGTFLSVVSGAPAWVDAATARTSLGLGTAATQNTGAFLAVASNLSDVASAATARTNIGLGTGNSPAFTALTLEGGTSPSVVLNGTSTGSPFLSFRQSGSQVAYVQYTDNGASADYLALNAPTFRFANSTILGSVAAAPPTGGINLALAQSSGNPSGIASNTAGLVALDNAGTCELSAWDEAGNVTQISPHAMDGPAWLYDADDPLPGVLREENIYLGFIRWTNQSRLARLLEMTPEELATLSDDQRRCVAVSWYTPTEDWDTNQTAQVARRTREIEQQNARRQEALDKGLPFPEPTLPPLTVKPMPQHLRHALDRRNEALNEGPDA